MTVTSPRKVILCCTHPNQFNGYSKVVYEISKELTKNDDIELYIFGFQNFYKKEDHERERSLPKVKEIYEKEEIEYIRLRKEDVKGKIEFKNVLFRYPTRK